MSHALVHSLDIVGSIFSLISTLFYVKADWRAWPIGVCATLLNISLYSYLGIYGDMTLEVLYFFSMFYGWYVWLRGGKNHHAIAISTLTQQSFLYYLGLAMIGSVIVFFLLKHYTNSTVPYLDSITTVLSLIAQYMTCRKILECWILWFIVDAIYVGLYINKGIPFHSVLLMIYLGLAVAGYLRWYQLKKTGT